MSDGLLHLGAMAVLTGVVYLNLEKAVAHPEEVATKIERLREDVRKWASGYDPEYSYPQATRKKRRPSRSYDSGFSSFADWRLTIWLKANWYYVMELNHRISLHKRAFCR